MRTTLSIWCILLLHIHVAAQQATYSFRTIDINQGLSQNSVIDMANDEKGFLWLATQDGLNRYDGKTFVVFRKNFDDITTRAYSRLGKIIPGNNHDLWLITSGGKLERFNIYNDSSMPYKALPGTILPPVSCFRQDKQGALWIGTEREGLFYHDSAARKTIHYTKGTGTLNSDSVQFIFQGRQKQYWILTSNGINLITPGQSTTTRKFLHRTAAPFISCSVMEEDSAGNLWVGTYAKGLYLKRPQDTTFTPFTGFGNRQTLSANLVVQAIRTDQQGCLWVGTLTHGLYIINTKEASIQQFKSEENNPSSLSYNDVLCIRPGKLQSMWVGTDGGGVSLYDRRLNIFSTLSKNTLPQNIPIEQVRAITTDPAGGLWIGTSSGGLTYVPGKRAQSALRINLKAVLTADSSERIMSLYQDANDIWVGTQNNGLLIIDRQTKAIKAVFSPQEKGPRYLPDHTVWCMLPADSNRVWLGTRNAGLCLLDKYQGVIKHFEHTPADRYGIYDNNVRAIIPINPSTLCLGFETEGIQLYNASTGKFSIFTAEAVLQHLDRNNHYTLKCLYYREPLLWIGTLGEGIRIYDLDTEKIFAINEDQGLPNNTIYSIVPDRQGALWMSTNKGITRFRPPADLKQTNRTHFTLFTAQDGLQGNEFNTGAYHTDAEGRLYFGGTNGLNWFDPARFGDLVKSPSPPIVITEATINNERWKGDTAIAYKKMLQLAWHQNSLSFNFASLDFVAPDKASYYYQLYPYDKNWIDAGNRNYAAYTNIPPGEYTFRVRALGQAVSGNDPMATLSILISPPFWKTWWFIGLCVLVLGTFLYGLYRYRINQLIALQKVRNRIATDLHDDIGSTLTNINILSELSRQKLEQQQEAALFLNRISEEVHNSSQALDDIVWSINTNNDTLEQTVARMRRYAAEVFDGANIRYALQLDEHFARRKLNMEQRRDCFLLFKEAINNIYKHAAAKNVSIRLWLERNQLHMTIEDDGKGFDIAQTTHRNGLKNMQQRITKWKGRIDIQSAPGKGTRTMITLPIN